MSQDKLTPREIEIIQWLSKGYTQKMIAWRTFISVDTVKTHIKNAMYKLNALNSTHLVYLYYMKIKEEERDAEAETSFANCVT